ncbi:MAG: hypothetical protein M1829_004640 [Trizodia sp. TS-e1964]|nr:MAG: hypothetical protein M1829_004640 [Trizodia sp. TS-e1964]
MAYRLPRFENSNHFTPEDQVSDSEVEAELEEPSMASWFSRTASSHPTQLAATAVLSGAVVAGAILGYQHARRREKVDDLKRSIPDIGREHSADALTEYGAASPLPTARDDAARYSAIANRARQGDYDEELIMEQLARNRVFLTDHGLTLLRASFVVVVGCGGVGSHAAAALARSGCSRLRLIDFDQVTLSSLNRHAVATLEDVGTSKVVCLRNRLEQIAPWVKFDCRNKLFSKSSAASLLGDWDGKKPDYLIDAIDNVDSKVELLAYCVESNLRVISAMGAGCKSDPTHLLIGDISTSLEDPLSRVTRRRLRALGISSGIPVAYSSEKPGPGKAQLLPLPDEEVAKGSVAELSVLPNFRTRILPVLGTMPAIFGISLANHVILALTNYPHEYLPIRGRDKLYDNIHANLQGLEERLIRAAGADATGLKLPVTKDDVAYLIEEIFRAKSVVSGLSTRLALVRWRRPPPGVQEMQVWGAQKSVRLALADLVCLTKEEAGVHEREVLLGAKEPEDLYPAEVVELVRARMEEERVYEQFR